MSIQKCNFCSAHSYQDEKYGYGMRVMNYCETNKKYRCTVCGAEKGNVVDSKKKGK